MANTYHLSDILFSGIGLQLAECAGKVIVVSGSGGGIGLQIARAFAYLGGKVVIAEISEKTGRNAEAMIRSEKGEATFICTDVSGTLSVHNLVEKVHSIYGPVDILVNNAILCPVAPVIEMEPELWNQVIAVNLRGTFLLTKAFLSDMLDRQQGVIVNMVSTDAMPGLSAYISSKQGILGFSQTLAVETVSCGVKVVSFAPGMVDTPGIRGAAVKLAPLLGMTEEQFLHVSLHSAYDGLMPPEHAGAATAYLALRLADEFHGQMVTGYEVLERAGLISNAPQQANKTAGTGEQSSPTRTDIKEIQSMIGKLTEIIGETGREFEKLPFFVRPMARNGFKSKAGMNLEAWQNQLKVLRDILAAGAFASDSFRIEKLKALIEYYRGVPQETMRFTRDPETIQMVSNQSAARIATIQRLQIELEALNGSTSS